MKKIYRSVFEFNDDKLCLLESEELIEKYCVCDDIVLMKDIDIYNSWINSINEDYEESIETNFWNYTYDNINYNEEFRFIGRQEQMYIADYYKKININELILEYKYIYVDSYL
ncbi:hypothetical protein [Clostridium celatum]|uniref:hypothetical protein n=1 Tax=Clostridium celatum TaxID=36834 RepID=UPI00189A5512|nr:hypothetical protein [Clostridium celatum]